MAKTSIGTTFSDFEYNLKGSYIETDIPEKLGQLEENILNFETNFQTGEFLKSELEMIARNLESTAVYFGEQHGLKGSRLLLIGENNLKATVRKNTIEFVNRSQDDYGRYYAGFVEYGHYSGETLIEARPFMRPALYAVAKASTGQIGQVLADLLTTAFVPNSTGYQGVHQLNFGHKLKTQYFNSLPNNQVRTGLENTKLMQYGDIKKSRTWQNPIEKKRDKDGGISYKRTMSYITGKDFDTMPNFQKITEKQLTPNRRNLNSSSSKAFNKLRRKSKQNTIKTKKSKKSRKTASSKPRTKKKNNNSSKKSGRKRRTKKEILQIINGR